MFSAVLNAHIRSFNRSRAAIIPLGVIKLVREKAPGLKRLFFLLRLSKIGSFLRPLSIIPIITEQACFDLTFIFERSPQINTNYSPLDPANPSFADCDLLSAALCNI